MDWCQSQTLLTNLFINPGSLKLPLGAPVTFFLVPITAASPIHTYPWPALQTMLSFVSSHWLIWFPSLEYSFFSNATPFMSQLEVISTRKLSLTTAHQDQTRCSPLVLSPLPCVSTTCRTALIIPFIPVKAYFVGDSFIYLIRLWTPGGKGYVYLGHNIQYQIGI